MKILHIYKDYHPIMGGIENLIKTLAEAQVRAGYDVTVLVTNPGGEKPDVLLNGVRVIRAKRLTTAASTPLSLDLLRQTARLEPDITHLHFPYPVGEVSQLLLGRKRPFIISYHSDIVKQKNILRLYGPILKRVLAGSRQILVSNDNYVQSSDWLPPFAHKCTTIPYSVDLERFSGAESPLLPPVAEPTLLFIGRHRYYKGVDTLIQALALVNGRLLIGGDGPERGNWERLTAELGLQQRIYFLGDIAGADLPAFYASGDIFVLPANSRAEAFGLVLQEAMAMGLPCVTSELGTGTSWLVQDGVSGFVMPPRQPEALAAALNRLVADPDLRTQMGQTGQDRARREFGLHTMLTRIEQVYDAV
ncbi:MAG: glycosyltransferase, partial [Aquificales bacterium]|nr:glycosyltransferase [Aquificales bacterium]